MCNTVTAAVVSTCNKLQPLNAAMVSYLQPIQSADQYNNDKHKQIVNTLYTKYNNTSCVVQVQINMLLHKEVNQ